MTSTTRTARCGLACRGGVGGERSGFLAAPIPIRNLFALGVSDVLFCA